MISAERCKECGKLLYAVENVEVSKDRIKELEKENAILKTKCEDLIDMCSTKDYCIKDMEEKMDKLKSGQINTEEIRNALRNILETCHISTDIEDVIDEVMVEINKNLEKLKGRQVSVEAIEEIIRNYHKPSKFAFSSWTICYAKASQAIHDLVYKEEI